MESIISSIKNPGWWFTVFLVGIVVSIVAGFLKDWIATVFTKYSQTFREHRKEKAERREILFEALATNEVFLILSMIRLMGLVVLSLLLMGLFTAIPAMAEIKEILCTVAPNAGKCARAINPVVEKAMIAGTGVLTILTNYRASSRFALVMEGLRRYRKRHDLPRVV